MVCTLTPCCYFRMKCINISRKVNFGLKVLASRITKCLELFVVQIQLRVAGCKSSPRHGGGVAKLTKER